MTVVLRPFNMGDEEVALNAWRAFAGTSFNFLTSYYTGQPWEEYIQVLVSHGLNLPPGHVAGVVLGAEVNGVLVGRLSARFELNEFLATRGGHIGYGVIEEHRCKGYASEILRQALCLYEDIDVSRVLITCDDANVASARVIENNGGQLERIVLDKDGILFRRYWVTTRGS